MNRGALYANLATLANALVGVGAILYLLEGNKLWAMLLVISGIGFDGLDGWLHRRSGAPSSAVGRVADSVADSITFGLAPAALVAVHTDNASLWAPWMFDAELAGAAILVLAVARLLWFTLKAHDRPYFVGVPTPQNAIGIVLLLLLFDRPAFLGVAPLVVIGGALLLAVTMVLPIRFPKIRRGSPLRLAMTGTGVALVLAILPLQFRPSAGSPLFLFAEAVTALALAGTLAYYLLGPWSVAASDAPVPAGSA